MKQLFVMAIIAALVIACGGNDKKEAATADRTTTPTAAAGPDGEKIYKQYCVTCHGINGDMGASGAANLAESKLSTEERIAVLHTGRPGTAMVSFEGILKEDQIKAVTDYTLTLKR
jgi:mono/diheme cytochrome c family protein